MILTPVEVGDLWVRTKIVLVNHRLKCSTKNVDYNEPSGLEGQ